MKTGNSSKSSGSVPLFGLVFGLSVMMWSVAPNAWAAPSRAQKNELAEKLPSKNAPKRSYIDFSANEPAVVVSPRASELDRILKNSDQDMNSATATVRSRKILAAPEGDSAEPISALAAPQPAISALAAPQPATPPAKATAVATPPPRKAVVKAAPPPKAATQPVSPQAVVARPIPPKMTVATQSPAAPAQSALATEPLIASPPESSSPEALSVKPDAPTGTPDAVIVAAADDEGFFESTAARSLIFVRSGYLNAGYKKFDDRMTNGATSLGLAASRGLMTSWGEFEVRAALDIYHPMDQSVTIDNIRMLTARTEVAYWFSRSRVRPGLSLGLGMADYSIRSYRAVSDENESTVVLKTHAKSRAFALIPATSLRIELSKELVVDAQTEFLALLGGDATDAAQGLGLTVSLGWMY